MVYTDGIHLTADSIDELYKYASKVGLNPNWIDFMGRNIHPHFDICGHVRKRVLADINVKKVTCREIVRLCKKNFRLPENESLVKDMVAKEPTLSQKLQLPSEADFERMFDNIFKRTGIKRSKH
jgi:hypothetical protein